MSTKQEIRKINNQIKRAKEDLAGLERIKRSLDVIKFIFILPFELNEYLIWKANKLKVTKAELLRSLLIEMKNFDKEYQEVENDRNR